MAWITHRPDRNRPYKVRWIDPATGRERSKSFTSKKTAQRFLRERQDDEDRGSYVDPLLGDQRFSEYAETWLTTKAGKAPGTRANIEGRLTNHLLPFFGSMPMNRIQPTHVRAWIAEMLGKGLSPATIRAAFWTLNGIANAAMEDGLIVRPPITPSVKSALPSDRGQHEGMVFLTAEEIVALSRVIDPRYEALILTAGFTGMRFGELAGLRLEKLNLLRKTVTVSASLSDVRGHLEVRTTKTGASRTLSLPQFLVDVLAQHIGQFSNEGWVFTSEGGLPLRRTNFYRRHFRPAAEGRPERPRRRGSAGSPAVPSPLPPDKRAVRFHDLRHSCAAMMIAQGAHPKLIQERLGHSTVRLNLDRYGHLFPGLEEAAVDGLENLYRASTGS